MTLEPEKPTAVDPAPTVSLGPRVPRDERRTGPRTFRGEAVEVFMAALPVIIATSSAMLMGFVDFWMVAVTGAEKAAAISPSSIIVFTIIAFFAGLLSCTNTFVSQSYGKQEFGDCSRYAWQGLWISIFVGIGALALWPAAPWLFAALNHPADVRPLETIYFQVRLPSIGPIVALTALVGFFQGVSRSRVAMVAAIVANALNVFFNWIFIYGNLGAPEMGVAGAALGTVFASWVQLAILLVVFMNRRNAETFGTRRNWRADRHRMWELFHLGVPAGLSWLLDVGTWGIFINVFIGPLGTIPLAASNMATQCMHLSFMPTVGLGIALTALVGQNIGRRDIETARSRARMGLWLGMAWMCMLGVVFLVFRDPLMRVFLKPGEDPEVVRQIVDLGSKIFILAAIFQIFDAIGIVCSSALRGAGDTRFPALATILVGLALFLPLCWLFTQVLPWEAIGAWTAATIYIFALGLLLLWRWNSRAWENINIFRRRAGAPAAVAQPTPYEPGDEISGR